MHSVDVPAVRGAVLAWAIAWFVLGYALYATLFGALGSLGSRAEDAQSVAGPVMVVLPVAYFASFAMILHWAVAASDCCGDTSLTCLYQPLGAPCGLVSPCWPSPGGTRRTGGYG